MIVDIKIKGVWLKVDIIGITGGTGTIDEVLAAGDEITENRYIDIEDFVFAFQKGDGNYLGYFGENLSYLKSTNATGGGNIATISVGSEPDECTFSLSASFNDNAKEASISAEAEDGNSQLFYGADAHTFEGKINNNTLQEFADDAAAVTGGLVPGDFYYTEDAGSGFLKVVLPAV